MPIEELQVDSKVTFGDSVVPYSFPRHHSNRKSCPYDLAYLTDTPSQFDLLAHLPKDITFFIAERFLSDEDTDEWIRCSRDSFHRLRNYRIKTSRSHSMAAHHHRPRKGDNSQWRYGFVQDVYVGVEANITAAVLSLIPSTVVTLELMCDEVSLGIESLLPPQLQSLTIDGKLKIGLATKFPDSITEMNLGKVECVTSIPTWPFSLRKLTFYGAVNGKTFIEHSLQKSNLLHLAELNVDRWRASYISSLPSSLTQLTIKYLVPSTDHSRIKWPQSLASLSIGPDRKLNPTPEDTRSMGSFRRWILPETLERLELRGSGYDMHQLRLPDGLLQLNLSGFIPNEPFDNVRLNDGLLNLSLPDLFPSSLADLRLPRTITDLSLGACYSDRLPDMRELTHVNQLRIVGTLEQRDTRQLIPQNLSVLYMTGATREEAHQTKVFIRDWSFPPTLCSLFTPADTDFTGELISFGLQQLSLSPMTNNLSRAVLPRSLRRIELRRCDGVPLALLEGGAPIQSSVRELDLSRVKSIAGIRLAGWTNVRILHLPKKLDRLTLEHPAFFPPKLRSLRLPDTFNETFQDWHPPKNLRELVLGNSWNKPLSSLTLPGKLEILRLGQHTTFPLDMLQLPDSLLALYLGHLIVPPGSTIKLPSRLQLLSVRSWYRTMVQQQSNGTFAREKIDLIIPSSLMRLELDPVDRPLWSDVVLPKLCRVRGFKRN